LFFPKKYSGGGCFNITSVALHLFWEMEHPEYLKKSMDPFPKHPLFTHTHKLHLIALEIDFLHTEYKNYLQTKFPFISLVHSHKYQLFLKIKTEMNPNCAHKTKS
jgi:hypothetical protein